MFRDTVVFTEERLKAEVDYFLDHAAFAFDVETHGEHRLVPTKNAISWVSLATHGRAIVVPMGHPNGDVLLSKAHRKKNPITGKMDFFPAVYDAPPTQLNPGQAFSILRPLFMDEKIIKIGHNLPFDAGSVAKYIDGPPAPPYRDTIVLHWLLDENASSRKLKDLLRKIFGWDYDKKNVGKQVEAHPFSEVGHYAYSDALGTWLLSRNLLPQFAGQGLEKVLALEEALTPVLVDMALEGQPVDEDTVIALIEDMDARLVDAEAKIYKAAGVRFNINSHQQKAKILYGPKSEGGQGLRAAQQTKGGADSTSAESLAAHPGNPLVKGLLEYAEIDKLRDYPATYHGEEGNPKKPRRIFDGKIHAELVQYGTVTGRFSCREPNLQNVPRPGTELGTKIRGLFTAPDNDHVLIVGDYGQIELVLIAHYIGHGMLYDAFMSGEDPHRLTAAGIAGKDPADVTSDERQALGKTPNFIIAYGGGVGKVMLQAKCSEKKARAILDQHKKTQPEVYRFKEAVLEQARTRKPPYLRTLSGRKRRLPMLLSSSRSWRSGAERQAVNSLIQGGAADIIKQAMVNTTSWPAWMHLTLSVHDELVAICPKNRADEGVKILKESMLAPNVTDQLRVPLLVDIKAVSRWSEAK